MNKNVKNVILDTEVEMIIGLPRFERLAESDIYMAAVMAGLKVRTPEEALKAVTTMQVELDRLKAALESYELDALCSCAA